MAINKAITAALYSRTHDGTANRDGYATHGTYSTNTWVGMVVLPESFYGKRITGVAMTVTANEAGTTATKTVYFYSSNHQSPNTAGTGSIFPKDELFFVKYPFRNTTVRFVLADDRLARVANYLANGGRMLVLYDPTSDENNYCRFTNVVIEITYEDYGTVAHKVNGEWVPCEVLVRRNGVYYKYQPLIKENGEWKECTYL